MDGYIFLGITLAVGVIVIGAPRVLLWLDCAIKRLEADSERMRNGR